MNLVLLKVKSFRNIKDAATEFSDGVNVITGLNGAGKTNLLEAAGLVLTGSSISGAKNSEMIEFSRGEAYVEGLFKKGGLRHKSEVSILPESRRILLNDRYIRSAKEIIEKVKCIVFSNADLSFFSGGPGLRRRFTASLCMQYEPSYSGLSGRYRKILKERNAALHFGCRGAEMNIWDEKLVEAGLAMFEFKRSFLSILNKRVESIMNEVFELNCSFCLRYSSEITDAERFLKLLYERERRERYLKTTLTGPHRDDFIPETDGKDLRKYGSSGECKSFLIALKLALYRLVEEKYNVKPVFIVDDFDSKMDAGRAYGLLNFLGNEGGQVFLTTPSDNIRFNGCKNVVKMVDGRILTEVSPAYV